MHSGAGTVLFEKKKNTTDCCVGSVLFLVLHKLLKDQGLLYSEREIKNL